MKTDHRSTARNAELRLRSAERAPRGAMNASADAMAIAEQSKPYLLESIDDERARLLLQAEAWTPAAERLFDAIGCIEGWSCLDLGCGATGILGTLARRAGAHGRVIGLDADATLLALADACARQTGLPRIELVHGDAFATGFPDAAFDLVHARFMFAPLGREGALLDEMLRLVRPGGIVVIQEPDAAAWDCWPPSRDFVALVEAIVATFAANGGDFNAGRHQHAQLRRRGCVDLGLRAEALALPGGHPYARLPLLFAKSLAPKLEAEMGRKSFARLQAGCEAACMDPDARITSFIVQQSWGRRPIDG